MESNNNEKSNVAEHELKEEVITSTNAENTIVGRPFAKFIIVRLLFLFLAIAAFSGTVDKFTFNIMKPVWEYDEEYLEISLLHASGYMAALGVPKIGLSLFSTTEFEPKFFGFGPGKITLGAALKPLLEIVDDLMDYIWLVIIFIIIQITFINLISMVSLKVLLGIGAAFCIVQYRKETLMGRMGISFIILAVVSYLAFPLILYTGAKAYESHQVEKSIELSENIGMLKEIASDIELKVDTDNVRQVYEALTQSVNTIWETSLAFFTGMFLMFVLIPLLTLGMILFIVRQSLSYLDMPNAAVGLESGAKKVFSRIGRRTRSRFFR